MDDLTEARLAVSTLGPARLFGPAALLTFLAPPSRILAWCPGGSRDRDTSEAPH